ncbi:hypothetical protein DUNSADRAFT_9771 [Dunaliella salina]|uniref:Uncharacterized protein n=1 Tax=Dunaliella salina TaxID=3046 RepID=A0ABQ7GGS9_DUNSA|nr:hypothetical protein DUNSADRAFT_9771 [Dunaliella salina]|eukprot:KAF5833786.1 hypothetical protein DUNSADRAFT_9771 [Dunaliella salina]
MHPGAPSARDPHLATQSYKAEGVQNDKALGDAQTSSKFEAQDDVQHTSTQGDAHGIGTSENALHCEDSPSHSAVLDPYSRLDQVVSKVLASASMRLQEQHGSCTSLSKQGAEPPPSSHSGPLPPQTECHTVTLASLEQAARSQAAEVPLALLVLGHQLEAWERWQLRGSGRFERSSLALCDAAMAHDDAGTQGSNSAVLDDGILRGCSAGSNIFDVSGGVQGQNAVLISVAEGVSRDVQHDVLLHQHVAYQLAPCMVTVLSTQGCIVTQNAESVAWLGCHSKEHSLRTSLNAGGMVPPRGLHQRKRTPTKEDQRGGSREEIPTKMDPQGAARLGEGVVHQSKSNPCGPHQAFCYLKELFYDQEDLMVEMQKVLGDQEPFVEKMEIRSPLLRAWMGAGEDEEVWHRVHIIRIVDPITCQPQYCLSQVNVQVLTSKLLLFIIW